MDSRLWSAAPPLATRPASILVAEDDAEMRALVAHALRREGHDVSVTSDGGELLERLALLDALGAPPDVIVTDMRMPVRGGVELLASLHDVARETPLIVMTAFGDLELCRAARLHGAVAVLAKPFDLRELCIAIEVLVGRGAA